MNTATHDISVFVGIDVSKRKLDCAVLLNGKIKSKVVSNDRPGFALLNTWLQERGAVTDGTHLCMEANRPLQRTGRPGAGRLRLDCQRRQPRPHQRFCHERTGAQQDR